ncbi:hypothetical protein SteCoe_4072 [Stentor coeruleus]|uniref:Uncharacterized protein n=1 Tax=Stentor coeruleus TaxID=5963 RepID=A0A1R2CVG4_9CILI|nr:hypothetical protein SteCoe_4072 [Stentor coeruleus]
MEFSTINPSDYGNALGRYPGIKFPTTPGFEGSGIVVKSGGGQASDFLLNKRVTVFFIGTWGEYCLAPSSNVFPLLDHVTLEQGASLNINPLTVAYMLEKVSQHKNKAFVQNAAASSLGKQLIKWANRLGYTSINLVRRQDQVDILKAIGAEHVFNTSEEGWLEKAKELGKKLSVTYAFDAISGTSTSDLAEIIQYGGVVCCYGKLSGQHALVFPSELIFQGKSIEGLWLSSWMSKKSPEEKYQVSLNVQQNIDILATEYSRIINLSEVKDNIEAYMQNSTNNKLLVKIQRN